MMQVVTFVLAVVAGILAIQGGVPAAGVVAFVAAICALLPFRAGRKRADS